MGTLKSENVLIKTFGCTGVSAVQADMGKNLVAVKGAIEPEKLLGFVRKKTRKSVEIVTIVKQGQKDIKDNNNNSSNNNNNNNIKKANEKQGDQNCSKDFNSIYHSELVYAPQLFSDEDPNSCCII